MRITSFILLLLILILGAFLRFYLIQDYPLGLYPDEAMNGNNALEAIHNTNFSAEGGPAFGWKIFYPENNGREGLFINLQAISLKIFGNEPWALRLVSAILGTLTIFGVFLLTKELFHNNQPQIQNSKLKIQNYNAKLKIWPISWATKIFNFSFLTFNLEKNEIIALLTSFFLATSYWHLNFSRIGFRAILLPFFATFGLYFLLKGLRQNNIWSLVWAGIFTGLGFYSYLAFRFMPFVLAVPIIWYFWQWHKENQKSKIPGLAPVRPGAGKNQNEISKSKNIRSCTPCAIMLFLFVTFVIALPIGWYFLQNPQDFIGRSGQVSIFSAESPVKEFLKSNLATLGMFFVRGDCNWRHNFNCQPQLHPLVAFFFVIGILTTLKSALNPKSEILNPKQIQNPNDRNFKLFGIWNLEFGILLAWLFFLSLPATLTKEGLPHVLRSIGLIPPVMIFSSMGAWLILRKTREWLEMQKNKRPPYQKQLERIRKEIVILFILVLLFLIPSTYRTYFRLWSENPNTYFAFSTDLFHLGKFLNEQAKDTKKYVVVNLDGIDVRGFPAPAQTVMFATDTFREDTRQQKNIVYVTRENWMNILQVLPDQKVLIAFLDGKDRQLIHSIEQIFPDLKVKVPGDFVVLQNW